MLSRAARALLDWPRTACLWPSKHDLDDPDFHWCGWPTLPGKSYCGIHYRRSIDRDRTNHGDEVHESIENAGLGDDTLRPFTGRPRIVLQRGNSIGSRRRFKVKAVGSVGGIGTGGPGDDVRRDSLSTGADSRESGDGACSESDAVTEHLNGTGGTARRSPDSVVDAAASSAPANRDGAVRAAHGLVKRTYSKSGAVTAIRLLDLAMRVSGGPTLARRRVLPGAESNTGRHSAASR
jgi:hypothetical protein